MPDISESRTGPLGSNHGSSIVDWWIAALLPAMAGVVLFGMAAARIIVVSIGVAILAEVLIGRMRRGGESHLGHAGLMGLLLALTLPAGAPHSAAAIGAAVAVCVGKLANRRMGRYVWQPALVGRVVVQFLFAQPLSLTGAMSHSPILAPGKLVFGEVGSATPVERGVHQGWLQTLPRPADDAILIERPVQALRRYIEGGCGDSPSDAALRLLRDELPPWDDTLMGVVPGALGETSAVVLLVVTLYLIWRGAIGWLLPLGVVTGALLTAWICPVRAGPEGAYLWLPGSFMSEGWPVGILYVLFHLTSGQLLLAAALLAGDPTTRPRLPGGQWLFGLSVGSLTIFMRAYGLLECESYWPILGLNTIAPWIDRAVGGGNE